MARSRQAVEMVVTAEPSLAAWSFENGIPALLFAHPDTMGIANRPDVPSKMRPWGSIEDVITKRNIKRSQDASKEDVSLFHFD